MEKTSKRCSRCGQREKARGQSYCKDCLKAYKHQYYLRHKEEILTKHKEYRHTENGRARISEMRRRYYKVSRERRRQYEAAYREKHRDELNARINARNWERRNHPVTTTLSVRYNLEVREASGGYTWTILDGCGWCHISEHTYTTKSAAWSAVRRELKRIKDSITKENERLKEDYECQQKNGTSTIE